MFKFSQMPCNIGVGQGWEFYFDLLIFDLLIFDLLIFDLLIYDLSIFLILKKDPPERFDLFHHRIDLSITKNAQFDLKIMNKFPTLIIVPVVVGPLWATFSVCS